MKATPFLVFSFNNCSCPNYQSQVVQSLQQSCKRFLLYALNGRDADQVLQIQAFPTVFIGTVGLIVEVKYDTQTTLNLKGVTFASASRDAGGYDMDAIKYLTVQDMPENNTLTFISGEIEKWAIFTSHDHANTKGKTSLNVNFAYTKVYETDMLENIIEELVCDNGLLDLAFKPFEIKTLMIRRK